VHYNQCPSLRKKGAGIQDGRLFKNKHKLPAYVNLIKVGDVN
jgi:hypothetical protein